MKHKEFVLKANGRAVAPRTGAWIETLRLLTGRIGMFQPAFHTFGEIAMVRVVRCNPVEAFRFVD